MEHREPQVLVQRPHEPLIEGEWGQRQSRAAERSWKASGVQNRCRRKVRSAVPPAPRPAELQPLGATVGVHQERRYARDSRLPRSFGPKRDWRTDPRQRPLADEHFDGFIH